MVLNQFKKQFPKNFEDRNKQFNDKSKPYTPKNQPQVDKGKGKQNPRGQNFEHADYCNDTLECGSYELY